MHKFFTVAPKPSGVLHRLCCATRKRVPPCSSPYSTVRLRRPTRSGCPRAWRNALRTAFSTPRYENLCIIRASLAKEFKRCRRQKTGDRGLRCRTTVTNFQGRSSVVESRHWLKILPWKQSVGTFQSTDLWHYGKDPLQTLERAWHETPLEDA